MGGDVIAIASNAFVIIHQAWILVGGNADQLRDEVLVLDEIDQALAQTYANKSGRPVDEMMQMMRETTWLRGPDAVEEGFATELLSAPDAQSLAKFDMSHYAHVPKGLSAPEHMPERTSPTGRRDVHWKLGTVIFQRG